MVQCGFLNDPAKHRSNDSPMIVLLQGPIRAMHTRIVAANMMTSGCLKKATCGTHVAKAEGHENVGWSKACNTQNWPGLSISQKGVQSKHLFSTERVLNDPNWHAENGQLKAVRQYWVPTFNHPAVTTGTSLDGLGWREISHLLVPCLTWAQLLGEVCSASRYFRCFAVRGLRHIVAAGDAKHPGSWRGDHSSAVGKFLLHKILHKIRIDSQVWGISHLLFDLFEYSIQYFKSNSPTASSGAQPGCWIKH